MANEVHVSQDLRSGNGDAVRIVPLYVADTPQQPLADAVSKAVSVPTKLTYRNGPLLTAVEVFTLFWGSPWQQPTYSAVAAKVNEFFDFILTSPLIDRLAEYSVPGRKIGHGKFVGTATVASPSVAHSVTDTAIRHLLQSEISTNALVPPIDSNTLYFVYLPPGVRVVQGGAASCQAFCGYHNDVSGKLFYAVMPYPGCAGCLGGLSTIDALTATSSHELCEAITDPVPGQGWYDDTHGEIGDICAWKTTKLGSYAVQLEWSNRANRCK
jgi:hypothetical protein